MTRPEQQALFSDLEYFDPNFLEYQRLSGSLACELCGLELQVHKKDDRYPDQDGQPFLRILCNEKLVKL